VSLSICCLTSWTQDAQSLGVKQEPRDVQLEASDAGPSQALWDEWSRYQSQLQTSGGHPTDSQLPPYPSATPVKQEPRDVMPVTSDAGPSKELWDEWSRYQSQLQTSGGHPTDSQLPLYPSATPVKQEPRDVMPVTPDAGPSKELWNEWSHYQSQLQMPGNRPSDSQLLPYPSAAPVKQEPYVHPPTTRPPAVVQLSSTSELFDSNPRGRGANVRVKQIQIIFRAFTFVQED
jgi:hypothetical protein